jgi:D-lactate dehydrogenase (cytochrome)
MIAEKLAGIVGAANVVSDDAGRAFYSTDLSYTQPEVAVTVVAPGSAEEVAEVVRVANEAGHAVVARGGGMSYTRTFVPAKPDMVLLDMRRMDKVIEVNAEDMYVIAEAGVTWEQLYLACAEHGVRTPFWGTLSGRFATVGGALSNNALFFGSTKYGSAAESVLGLEVVLAGGKTIRTGSWAHSNGTPFTRYYGPDLSGMFIADTGALGIKTRVSLKLVPLPQSSVGFAFSVPSFDASNELTLEMAKLGIATEVYGFDPLYNGVFADLGFGFLRDVQWSVFGIVDGADDASAEAGAAILKELGSRYGEEIDPSVPMAVRADPFGAVRSVLMGPKGEVWMPIHGIFPKSKAKAAADAAVAYFAKNDDLIKKHDIKLSLLTLASGTDFIFEPSFYWFDELGEFRLEKIEQEWADQWRSIPHVAETREVALRMRKELSAIFDDLGAVHLQIGKWYEFQSQVEPAYAETLLALKRALDPNGLINPGSLGIE